MSAYEEVAESRIIWCRDSFGADGTALMWPGVFVEIDCGRLTRFIYRSSATRVSRESGTVYGSVLVEVLSST